MATDNADELQAVGAAYRGRSGAPAAPKDQIEGKAGSYSGSGNASNTAFVVTHNLGRTPTAVIVTPTSAVASALHSVGTKTANAFTVTFAAAPATGTNNVTFDYLVVG